MHISKFSRLRRYILLNTIIYWPRRTKISGFEALLVQIPIGKCGYWIQNAQILAACGAKLPVDVNDKHFRASKYQYFLACGTVDY